MHSYSIVEVSRGYGKRYLYSVYAFPTRIHGQPWMTTLVDAIAQYKTVLKEKVASPVITVISAA